MLSKLKKDPCRFFSPSGRLIFMMVTALLISNTAFPSTLTFSWDSVDGDVSGYRVYYRASPSLPYSLLWEGSQVQTSIDLDLLSIETTYAFTVRAFNESGESYNSDVVYFYVNAPECPDCSGDAVVLQNVTFPASVKCVCLGTRSIIAGPGVVIKNGADVTFQSPSVILEPGVNSEEGSRLSIQQD